MLRIKQKDMNHWIFNNDRYISVRDDIGRIYTYKSYNSLITFQCISNCLF